MGRWAITHRPPITVPLTQSGETTILTALTAPNTVYRLFIIQFVNKGKKDVDVELKEGILARWSGRIEKKASLTADFGVAGWTFDNNTPLNVNVTGNSDVDVNVMSYGTVLTSI